MGETRICHSETVTVRRFCGIQYIDQAVFTSWCYFKSLVQTYLYMVLVRYELSVRSNHYLCVLDHGPFPLALQTHHRHHHHLEELQDKQLFDLAQLEIKTLSHNHPIRPMQTKPHLQMKRQHGNRVNTR